MLRLMDLSNPLDFKLELLGPTIHQLIRELATPQGWWAAAALAACVLLAMRLASSFEKRLAAGARNTLLLTWIDRIGWPLIALMLVMVAKTVLSRFVPVSMLTVARELLVPLVAIRALLLAVRQTFPTATWLGSLERTIAPVVWSIAALHVLDLLPMLLETLDSIAIPLGKSKLSLLQVITGLITLAFAGLIALWISSALDARLALADAIPQGARAVISRISKPLLTLIALLIALPIVGIDLTVLSVFGGALGVGLGFGMQKIVANYISGFIILLDHSIEPGRLIRVDRYRGIVSEIRTRYTVIKGLDGVDAIVPNEMLVNSVVESETFSDSTTRVSLQIGVGYQSDVEQAMQILVDAAASQPRVMQTPAPRAFLVAFADSAITLEVGFWVKDPEIGTLALRSDINLEVLRRFRAAGIEIPFPQREVTVRQATAVDLSSTPLAAASVRSPAG